MERSVAVNKVPQKINEFLEVKVKVSIDMGPPFLRYPIYSDHISYLVSRWWDFSNNGIIFKGLSNIK
jgi:hypothetical protein